jgi:4-amino-4-deoxy-L-arabinose transferase-like glycosyltransferase
MKSRRIWIAVLVTAALIRLLTLSAYPLHDTTEARYGEVARLMVVSGDWITPQIELGVPFWAKPPLSTWLTAGSFELFGFSEFAARLPAFLLTMLTALIVFRIGKTCYSEKTAIIACAILLTSVLGFVASGAVMTDAALMLATTLSLASFSMTIRDPRPFGRYGLFVGMGLGLLAKGPVALVLIGTPILVWSLWHKNLLWLWRTIPWATGSIVMLVIAGPWYLLAEINSPGFLEYFLIGEHWLRFVESGWQGDLYGYAHPRPRGTIWLYGVAAAMPWSIFALYAVARAIKEKSPLRSMAPQPAFLLLWALTPLVFFTFAGNILPAYVLPGLPAFALLLGNWLSQRGRVAAVPGFIVPGMFAAAAVFGLFGAIDYRSQRDLVEYHYENSPTADLYYFPKVPHSASFYSSGRVQSIRSESELVHFVAAAGDKNVAIREKYYSKLPDRLLICLRVETRIHDFLLLRPIDPCP